MSTVNAISQHKIKGMNRSRSEYNPMAPLPYCIPASLGSQLLGGNAAYYGRENGFNYARWRHTSYRDLASYRVVFNNAELRFQFGKSLLQNY